MKKLIFILLTMTILSGCSSKKLERPDNTDIVCIEEVQLSLENYERPEAVAELPKPDKTLIDPMFSLSTEAFPAVQVLSANDYFKYDLLSNENFDELDKITEPTNINVTLYRDSAYTDWSYKFSCFIYKIDSDYVYLGTAGHCIIRKNDITRAKITFYDRSEIYVSLDDYKKGAGFGSSDGDYAMYRFPTSAIPYELLLRLKEVSYDEAAMRAVKPGDTLYSGNIYAMSADKDYDKVMTVYDSSSSIAKNSLANYNAYFNSNYFLTDTPLVNGQSGSAIFDQYGNLVAICSGGSWNKKVGIYTVADKMDELYEAFKQD